MKTSLGKFLAAALVWLALSVSMHASSLYFAAAQNTGTQYPQQNGSVSIDNPSSAASVPSPSSPAISVDMIFTDPFGGALFQASTNTNVAKNTYYVGSFPSGGADCYITIY